LEATAAADRTPAGQRRRDVGPFAGLTTLASRRRACPKSTHAAEAEGFAMPRGDKSAYTDKQKRKAEHIEDGYKARGVSSKEAAKRAWATVNKEDHGGKKSGSGRGRTSNRSASRKGGRRASSSSKK
jgi:plasmid stabilization system protein ParE